MTVESSLREVTRYIEASEQGQVLDQLAEQLQGALRTAVEQGGPAARRLKNWLHGTWLGHPLHPALTDVPIGAWTVGFLLDVVGAEEQADAAMTIGALAALPTALAGAADWSDMDPPARRVGLVHAVLNTVGLSCVIASLFARRNDHRALGVALSTAGLSVASLSAWLGGSMVYREGIGVSHNAFEPGLDEFQPVMSADSLEPGKLTYAELNTEGGRLPLVLYKSGSSASIYALSNVCSHLGGPLAEGRLVDGECVECPWHASQFRLSDGAVRQGPATVPQPVFETRVRDGSVEVRRIR